MGLLMMNNTIKEMKMLSNPPQAKRRRQESVESNLWVSDVTNTDLLNVLDRLDLAELSYVSEDTKSALLSAMSNTIFWLQISITSQLVSVFLIKMLQYVNKQRNVRTLYIP